MDTVSQKTRSRMMAGIRNKDTKPEMLVRKHLHSLGFRYRLHRRVGKTRPDCPPKMENIDIRSWLLLASPPRLQAGKRTQKQHCILEKQVQPERRA